ncbi:hypothetical protein KP77_10690 [Jeotgalibacillus alimentarius]|uniref:Uncharacterized protein n=1 Tax=Jeotgalibacillus alimentarius TaxID=135826 RepID=A0A0C2VRL9_9BACL|nr:hypothetical protein [Jeotgalibacillus alimentarius]KIL51557.1 hypothetical protein KP77_10690 [Jeotgalibacillus alimentarius]
MLKVIKLSAGLVASIVLGLIFGGGIDLDDIKFRKNMKRLKKEPWFKKIEQDGLYYEKIYQNEALKEYLFQDDIVNRILEDEKEKDQLIKLIQSV